MNSKQFSFILCVFVTVLLLVKDAKTQAMYMPNSEDPNNPGLCFYRDEYGGGKTQFYLKPGQKRRHPKLCFEVKCSDDLGLSTTGCGLGANLDHCRFIPGDLSKPYPRCCGEFVC